MTGPLTLQESRAFDRMIDAEIEDWQEAKDQGEQMDFEGFDD